MAMVKMLIAVPKSIKAKLAGLRRDGTTASGFIRKLVEAHFKQERRKTDAWTYHRKELSMNVITTTAALKGLGFSRGEVQRVRNYAKSAGISVSEMVRICVEEMAYQVAIIPPNRSHEGSRSL